MQDKPEKLVVIVQESVIASLIKDAGTFLLFGGLLYFNHRVLAGNGWIDFVFILIVFMWLAGRSTSKVFTGSKADAIKWLEGNKDV